MFLEECQDAPECQDKQCYKLQGKISKDLHFVARNDHLHLKEAVSVHSTFLKNNKECVENCGFVQVIY